MISFFKDFARFPSEVFTQFHSNAFTHFLSNVFTRFLDTLCGYAYNRFCKLILYLFQGEVKVLTGGDERMF